ncbi:2-dehydro-3-deoxygalactonokinase, partial [Nitratireductor sp. GCM10026969]|uniref:2-dehydro-3-deoxygalactonokinase n=1 Tax=Nitratireductor sp. GCM10026969 TaxID=3252645 RepID=UPI00360AA03E
PADLPVVVAGMAGARGAWREAAYLDTPAPLDALHSHAVRIEGLGRDVRILPGVCQRTAGREDVMRGEETQLAGARAAGHGTGLFCLPGTHSKWAWLEAGRLTAFTTFMTGELFAILSEHSILAETVGTDGESASSAFTDAVGEMLEEGAGLTGRLFTIRAAALLGRGAPAEAKTRLSGLLIGAEVAAMRARCEGAGEVFLVAGGAQARAYEAALTAAGFGCRNLDGGALVRQGLFFAARALWPERTIA